MGIRILYRGGCPWESPVEAVIDRLEAALMVREKAGFTGPKRGYRLVNSDGDMLSGLIVDVYNDVGVVQSSGLAIDRHIGLIASWISRELGLKGVFEKSVQRSRRDLGLEPRTRWLTGVKKEEAVIEEAGVKFIVDVVNGQKTGFFLDQRANRVEFGSYAGRGDMVLDLFSYTGGFGLHAAFNGAGRVVFVEEDPWAVRMLERNAGLNGFTGFHVINKPIREAARDIRGSFDLAAVDPPAFIQKRDKESFTRGLRAYRRAYKLGLDLLSGGGTAFLSSCSFFLRDRDLVELVSDIMGNANYRFIGSFRRADRDHVVGSAVYLDYLKGLFIYKE